MNKVKFIYYKKLYERIHLIHNKELEVLFHFVLLRNNCLHHQNNFICRQKSSLSEFGGDGKLNMNPTSTIY